MKTKIDFLGKGKASGDIAAYIQANGGLDSGAMRPFFDPEENASFISVYKGTGDQKDPANFITQEIQTNATLRRDEWIALDDAVLKTSRSRLVGIADLEAAGLVKPLGNAMGTTVLVTETLNDTLEAEMSIDGISRSKNDRANFEQDNLPIPIIHVDYQINSRVLAQSRNNGNGLDTTQAEMASRRVSEKLESLLFTSITYKFAGGYIYSYLTHPDRNLYTISTSWATATAKEIVDDVIEMKALAITAKHFGPFQVYIPTAYEKRLDEDYVNAVDGTVANASSETIRERILRISNIAGVKTADTMATDNVILVQMTSDVVRLVKGMGIQNVEWQAEGKFVNHYKVMTIQVPQIRADQSGNSGVVHGSV